MESNIDVFSVKETQTRHKLTPSIADCVLEQKKPATGKKPNIFKQRVRIPQVQKVLTPPPKVTYTFNRLTELEVAGAILHDVESGKTKV